MNRTDRKFSWSPRWRPQFSLGTLLAIVTLSAVCLSHLSQRARCQRRAVDAIERVRGIVTYDFQLAGRLAPSGPPSLRKLLGDHYFATAVEVSFAFEPHGARDEVLEAVGQLPRLQAIDLCEALVTDSGLPHLKYLRDLRHLTLEKTRVTGDGLLHLRGLTTLESLNLKWTKVGDGTKYIGTLHHLQSLDLGMCGLTDGDLKPLKQLQKLRWLSLGGNRITSEGLAHIQSLTNLESVLLDCTNVDNTAVETLSRLTKLELLELRGTYVTRGAARQHRRNLPGIEILQYLSQ